MQAVENSNPKTLLSFFVSAMGNNGHARVDADVQERVYPEGFGLMEQGKKVCLMNFKFGTVK